MSQRIPDLFPIDFVVVGGGAGGLTSAIALARCGHKVTVLDDTPSYESTNLGSGARIPPNATKVLYRWGMEERLRECSIKNTGTMYADYHTGTTTGVQEWEQDVLEETGGDFILLHYSDFRRILAESAREHGAILRTDAKVVGILADPERPSVTLESGEVVTGDVVIGADGNFMPNRTSRQHLLHGLGQDAVEVPTGLQFFNALIPESGVANDAAVMEMINDLKKTGMILTWFAPTFGAIGFPIRETLTGVNSFSLYVYAEYESKDRSLRESSSEELLSCIGECDPRLTALAREVGQITTMPMVERPALEDWVHPNGRILAIGDAAHPIPTGSHYAVGMAVGDAAALGRLFSHLHRREQISSFLSALQEIRADRVEQVMRSAKSNIFAISLPPGIAEARNQELRERAEKGIRTLGKGYDTSEEMIQAVEDIFAYDPEDEADNWWVRWGLTQERAARIFDLTPMAVNLHTTSSDHTGAAGEA
ncbi:FAD/NAD(P)-binding domain-containing protein [Fomes fomentarius]|nr:FAD/NAD(P)-binding domain-containing protein [Fomes fomentarius]